MARSSPAMDGDCRAFSTSSSGSVEAAESTPRITPRERKCRTSARVSMPVITGTPDVVRKSLRRLIRAPVAGERRKLAHHQSFDVRPRRFVVGLVGAVVADLRIGENDDLAGIRRIGEDFLIAGDGGIENDFAGPFDGRTKTPALEDRAVFQGENCGVQLD